MTDRRKAKSSPSQKSDFWTRLLDPYPDTDFLETTGCPACQSPESALQGKMGPTWTRKCRDCGLVFVSPRLSSGVREAMYRDNPSPLDGPREAMLRNLMAGRLETMLQEMPPLPQGRGASDLLDFGCGFGHFLHLARPHFRSVHGLELSRTQADYGRRQWDLDISSIDALQGGWDGRHHVITAWEVLEHLPDPKAFLGFCFDHLEPGGQLILSTPNGNSLFRHLLGPKWFYAIPSQHLTYFDKSTLEGLLKKVGFGECRFRTSGRSLLRERFNSHNPTPRSQDEKEAWIENLRSREIVEERREARPEPWQSSAWARFWNRLVWHAWNPWITSGFGDQLRAYAIKP